MLSSKKLELINNMFIKFIYSFEKTQASYTRDKSSHKNTPARRGEYRGFLALGIFLFINIAIIGLLMT